MPKVVKMVKKADEPTETEPTPKKKAAPAPEKPPRAEQKPRYTGKTTGMRVREYQNHSLEQNMREHLTDEQLVKRWREEFPMAARFSEKTIRGVRSAFNKGRHGNEIPKKLNRPFDADGNPLALRGEKKAEAKSEPVVKKK